jgi:tetratricopeptide (TPR) repeat protein
MLTLQKKTMMMRNAFRVTRRLYSTTIPTAIPNNLFTFQQSQLKLGYQLFTENKFIDSYQVFCETIDSFEEQKCEHSTKEREHLLAIGYNNLAETLRYMMKGGYTSPTHPKYSYATILKLYSKALDIWNKYENDQEVDYWRGTLHNNMGLYYMETVRNQSNALEQFLKSSHVRKTLLDQLADSTSVVSDIDLNELRSHLAITFNNIGQCYVNMKQSKQAMPFFENAKHLFEQQEQQANQSTRAVHVVILNNIGLTFFEMNRYNDALDHFYKAIQVIQQQQQHSEQQELNVEQLMNEYGAGEELGVTLNNIGTALYMKSQFQEAEDYLRKALKVFEQVFAHSPNHKHIATTCTQLALTLREKHSKMPRPQKEMLKQNAQSVLSKMGWNPFKSNTSTSTSSTTELTPEQFDFNESKQLLERARTIANIHQAENDLFERQKHHYQKQKESENKRFKGTSMFSRILNHKSSSK